MLKGNNIPSYTDDGNGRIVVQGQPRQKLETLSEK
jgi:hypothetical protein